MENRIKKTLPLMMFLMSSLYSIDIGIKDTFNRISSFHSSKISFGYTPIHFSLPKSKTDIISGGYFALDLSYAPYHPCCGNNIGIDFLCSIYPLTDKKIMPDGELKSRALAWYSMTLINIGQSICLGCPHELDLCGPAYHDCAPLYMNLLTGFNYLSVSPEKESTPMKIDILSSLIGLKVGASLLKPTLFHMKASVSLLINLFEVNNSKLFYRIDEISKPYRITTLDLSPVIDAECACMVICRGVMIGGFARMVYVWYESIWIEDALLKEQKIRSSDIHLPYMNMWVIGINIGISQIN